MLRFLFALVILLTPASFIAQTQYSHGDPTNEEQYMLELINRARATPKEEGNRLMDTEDSRVQAAYQYFNINKAATKAAFNTYPSRPPLAFHPDLITAARDHTADMVKNNFQGHVGSDGSSLQQRFQRVNYQSIGMYGENVSAYSESIWFGHCGLNVDWGEQNQIDLGHRSNIMNFNTQVYTEIGLGITKTNGGLQSGTVGPWVITQDFGVRAVKYITGVVYEDKNNNQFYDVGEGMAGVKVEASGGTYYAVTSTSGGYAIPYSGSGPVTVTASGGGLSGSIPLAVVIGSESLKLDFNPVAEIPGIATLLAPADGNYDLSSFRVLFDWDPVSFADTYEFQLATDAAFTNIIHTSTESTTGEEYTVDACQTTYYWRVRGVNAIAPGPWSAVFTFQVADTKPAAPSIVGPIGETSIDVFGELIFSWSAIAGRSEYLLQIFNADGELRLDTTVVGTQAGFILDRFVEAVGSVSEFSWNVATKGNCSFGTGSDPTIVKLTITSVAEISDNARTSVVPYPATAHSRLTFNAPVEGIYSIVLISVTGERVRSLDQAVQAGQQSIEGIFEGIPSGLYGVVVEGPQFVQRIPVIVRH